MTIGVTLETKGQGTLDGEFSISTPAELNNLTRNDSRTIILELNENNDLTVADGETYTISSGDTETYQIVTVEVNATLVVDGTLNCNTLKDRGTVKGSGIISTGNDYDTQIDRALNYDIFAGKFTISETLDATQKFVERFDESATKVDSLLVGVKPDTDLTDSEIRGVWGLINNVTDTRNRALSIDRIEFEIMILAEYSDFADHAAVENDLEL